MYRRGLVVAVWMGLLGGLVGVPGLSQPTTPLERLRDAFAAGDAQALLASAADRVEISLLGSSKLYSRAQATYVMQDFFRRYPSDGFALQNEDRNNNSWFATGRYRYKHAEHPLQVFLRLRLKEDRWELREVRIEERRRE